MTQLQISREYEALRYEINLAHAYPSVLRALGGLRTLGVMCRHLDILHHLLRA